MAKDPELKLLNDVWKIIQYMSVVPEEEKTESKAFNKVYRDLHKAYATRTPKRKVT